MKHRPSCESSRSDAAHVSRRQPYDVESVLQVAVQVFSERGYDGTSMADLARALGVHKSSIYHHVPGKEELLRLALDRALDSLFALTCEDGACNGTAVDRLEHILGRTVQVLTQQLPYVTLLLRIRGNTAVERRAMKRRGSFDRFLQELVRQAVDEGHIRPDVDPGLTARLLVGMVNSISEWHRPGQGTEGGDVVDALISIAFDGLRPCRTSPGSQGRPNARQHRHAC